MRTAGYGQFVGSGLDRSGGLAGGHAPPHTPPHVGAGHARPGGVRRTGVCGITCGPGMPGPYRGPKTKTSRPNRRGGSFLCE